MAKQKNPSYFNYTWTAVRGCQHATLPDGSEHLGCRNCFAEALAKRNPKCLGTWGADGRRVRGSESYWQLPVKWDREAASATVIGRGGPRVLYDLGDLFEDWEGLILSHCGDRLVENGHGEIYHVTPSYSPLGIERPLTMSDCRWDAFELIDQTNLTWIIPTKRPWLVREMWPTDHYRHGPDYAHRDNVWLGVSVSDQDSANQLVPELLKLRDLVPVLFLSIEPLLEPIDLSHWVSGDQTIDWVIVGAESGPNRRPCEVAWIADVAAQCKAASVPCWVKQDSARQPGQQGRIPDELWAVKELP